MWLDELWDAEKIVFYLQLVWELVFALIFSCIKEEFAREGLLLFFHVPYLDIGKTVQDSAYTVVISNGEQFCNYVVNVFLTCGLGLNFWLWF